MQCPCGNDAKFESCCAPIIQGKVQAANPEALMRARYSAYAHGNTAFLRDSLAPEVRHEFDEKNVREWSKQSQWLGLKILRAEDHIVEFVAKYKAQGKVLEHHETSTFKKDGDKWFFVDGESHVHEEGKGHEEPIAPAAPQAPIVRASPKIGRNDPCHCGSGKKFKKCHGVNE